MVKILFNFHFKFFSKFTFLAKNQISSQAIKFVAKQKINFLWKIQISSQKVKFLRICLPQNCFFLSKILISCQKFKFLVKNSDFFVKIFFCILSNRIIRYLVSLFNFVGRIYTNTFQIWNVNFVSRFFVFTNLNFNLFTWEICMMFSKLN